MKNLYYITAMHGDECMPTLALAATNIPQLIANPKALSIGKRWVDADLNASFGLRAKTYESRRAREVLGQIPKKAIVVDFHTTDTANVPFAIIVDPAMLSLALKTGLRHIVYMKHNIKKGHALINHRNGVSVEAGKHKDAQSFDTTLAVVKNLQRGKLRKAGLYEVYGKLTKPGKYTNFKLHKDGFYPVLAGESSYNFYGLKARKVKSFSI